jgi:putative transposase
MLLQPYAIEELHFAWSYRVYLRFQTSHRQDVPKLLDLTTPVLRELLLPYQIHALESETESNSIRVLVSLLPSESGSSAASKIKGRISKWLTDQSSSEKKERHLARGYFAVTTGDSTSDEVNAYLTKQVDHHGYQHRPRPPTYVQSFPVADERRKILATDHAVTSLRFHVVLATEWRRGVFNDLSAPAVTQRWQSLEEWMRFRIEKVSFLPDHIHIAVELHPAAAPDSIILKLMNEAQEWMWSEFEMDVIRSKVTRLWQPSAYVGSFGDLRSAAISAYVKQWENDAVDD